MESPEVQSLEYNNGSIPLLQDVLVAGGEGIETWKRISLKNCRWRSHRKPRQARSSIPADSGSLLLAPAQSHGPMQGRDYGQFLNINDAPRYTTTS